MIEIKDTIAAIATPPGKGGIGIIRISGPQSLSIAAAMCDQTPQARQFQYTNFKDVYGATLDKGVVMYFKSPASYTGEDVVELQGHGGQFIMNAMLQLVLSHGARLARPGEFTERAYLNDKLDLLQAEAIADLIESSSEQAAQSAMRSLNGEFSRRIESLSHELTQVRVFVESALDFPEEELEFLRNSDIETKINKSSELINAILLAASSGQMLREGFSAAIVGPPNAGKSSLLNALAQTNKAIVSSLPGTTRDLIEEKILINGTPMNVVDTAGIRETADNLELEGIRRTRKAISEADIILLVKEARQGKQERECSIKSQLPHEKKKIIIYNKIDLLDMRAEYGNEDSGDVEVLLSAKTHEGIDLLKEEIVKVLGLAKEGEITFNGRSRHIRALEACKTVLQEAAEKLKLEKVAAELLAEDLAQAQRWLEDISGATTTDDLLGEIFSSFCIGK
jgi:tRNA modification GTPase